MGGFDASGCHLFPRPTETATRLSYHSRFPPSIKSSSRPSLTKSLRDSLPYCGFQPQACRQWIIWVHGTRRIVCGNGLGGHTSISFNASSASENGANPSSLRPSVVSATYNMLGQFTSPCTYSIAMPLLVSPPQTPACGYPPVYSVRPQHANLIHPPSPDFNIMTHNIIFCQR